MLTSLNCSGTWRSTYHYKSTSREGDFTGEHNVQLFCIGNQVVVQSIPDGSGSYLFLRLTLDDHILTGTWHEYTEPKGHYKGAHYYGAIQYDAR